MTSGPPPPEDKAAGWGGSGKRVRDRPHDRARREHAPCKPQRRDQRGCERRVGRATTGATRHAPPPLQRDRCRASCLRRASVVPATCVQRREDDKPPPPHTTPPPQGWGVKVGRGGKPPPPPEDKAARWGGIGERVRDGPHDRARRKHAPCKPQRGRHRGCERRVGRAMTGATRQAPPPTSRGTSAAPRACAVLATCLRQRTDSEDAPPPPPSPPPTQERGADSEETARGQGGGGQRTDRNAGGRDEWRAVEVKKKRRVGEPSCRDGCHRGLPCERWSIRWTGP